jgi:diguanylate cyclase (GGDEF)-like protein/PAS domain S-box-containing protein
MQFENNLFPVQQSDSLSDSNGQPNGCEGRLREFDALCRVILDRISEIVLMTDEEGAFAFISPNIEHLLGYSPADVEALGTIQAFLGDNLFEPHQLATDGEIQNIERIVTHKTGNTHWLSIYVKQVSWRNATRLYCCRDISDRKQLELERDRLNELVQASTAELRWCAQKLQEERQNCQRAQERADRSEQFFNSIFENIPHAIFVKDAKKLSFVNLNKAGEKLLGYSRAEIIGKTDYDFFPKEIAEGFVQKDREVLANGQMGEILEETLQTRDKQIKTLYTQKTLICDRGGVPQYLLKISEDLTEFQKSEQALKKSEATNRALLNAIPDLMLRVKRDGTYVDCKAARAFAPLLPPPQLIGKNLMEVLPPQLGKLGIDCIEQAFLTGEVQTCEYQLPHNDKVADYESRTVACGEDEVLILVRDISDRKATEAALRASENRFRAIFEQAAVGIVLLTREGDFFRTNQKFCQITGYTPTELRPLSDLELTHPEDRARVRAYAKRLLEGELSTFSIEKRYQQKDGDSIWVNFTASLLCEWEGQQQYFVAVIQDISDRVFAEATLQEAYISLREREAQYRTLTNHAPVGIFQTNARKEVIFVNPFWCEITGMTPEAAYGNGWSQALHPGDRDRALAEWSKEPEQRSENVEFRFQRQDGKIFWVLGNSTSLRDAEGRYQGEIGTILEISKRKQAEENLQRQAERERLIAAMQGRVRRSLDLNTILNTTVEEVRQFLQCDRVLVYRFNASWSGAIVAESVREPWEAVLGTTVCDPCFTREFVRSYQEGRIHVVNDINSANLAPCHFNLLAQFQAKANLVIPILQGETLWGLLVAHHCAEPWSWQPAEIDFLGQLATQVGIATQQSQLYQQLKEANQKLHRLATIDGLTQVANRRCFDAYLTAEWRRMTREQAPLSLILCDIDYFKLYNDTYGHPAGDTCLRQVATAIRNTLKRPADLVARYGGEEFAIVLPNTNKRGMMWIAQSMRRAVKRLNISHQASSISHQVTLSLGGATIVPTSTDSLKQLIDAADRALYQAKTEGRDRAVVYKLPA